MSNFINYIEGKNWYKVSSFVTLILLLTLVVNIRLFGFSLRVLGYTWLVSSYTFYPFMILSLIMLFDHKGKLIIEIILLSIIWVFSLWFIGSSEYYAELGRNLLYYELKFYFFESGYKDYILGLLFSWRLLLFSILFITAYIALRLFYKHYIKKKILFFFTIQAMSAIMILGVSELQYGIFAVNGEPNYDEAASAPWSIAHNPYKDDEISFNFSTARDIRELKENPFWADGRDEKIVSLAGQYKNNSIVVVMLESHRASDISGLGEGAYNHKNLSPVITGYMQKGLLFTNYIASGIHTGSARWSMMTGLTNAAGDPAAVYRKPDAGIIGRMP